MQRCRLTGTTSTASEDEASASIARFLKVLYLEAGVAASYSGKTQRREENPSPPTMGHLRLRNKGQPATYPCYSRPQVDFQSVQLGSEHADAREYGSSRAVVRSQRNEWRYAEIQRMGQ